MSEAAPTRLRERLADPPASAPPIDLEPLLGTWIVFEPGTSGITRVDVEGGPEDLRVRVFGSGDGEVPDWGPSPAQAFADDVAGGEAWAFRATYAHGFQRVELFGYLNRGVLAVDAGTSFAEPGSRADYFTRELFFRT